MKSNKMINNFQLIQNSSKQSFPKERRFPQNSCKQKPIFGLLVSNHLMTSHPSTRNTCAKESHTKTQTNYVIN